MLNLGRHNLISREKLILIIRNGYFGVDDFEIQPKGYTLENELVFVINGLFCTNVMINVIGNLF